MTYTYNIGIFIFNFIEVVLITLLGNINISLKSYIIFVYMGFQFLLFLMEQYHISLNDLFSMKLDSCPFIIMYILMYCECSQ